MMKPENWVKRRYLHNTHISKPESIMNAIMKGLKVANNTTVGFIADLIKRLIHRKQLVKHVTVVRLLLADAFICRIIAAGGIESESIYRRADSVVPVLELKLTL